MTLFILLAEFISEPKTCQAKTENNSINISYEFDSGPRTYSENVTRLDTEVGYRFNIASKRISITPSAHLGYYFGNSNTLVLYGGISVSLGFSF
jgi:hypothetical protein